MAERLEEIKLENNDVVLTERYEKEELLRIFEGNIDNAPASKEFFKSMNDQEREVLKQLTTLKLEYLVETIDEWLPTAISVEPGEVLTIKLYILLATIDEQLQLDQILTKKKIQDAKEKIEEWEGEAPPAA